MNKLILLLILLINLPLTATPLTMELKQRGDIVEIHVNIEEGSKLVWTEPGEEGFPTSLILGGNAKVLFKHFPARQEFKSSYGTNYGYTKHLIIELKVLSKGKLDVTMKWLCCGSMCVPGETQKSIILK